MRQRERQIAFQDPVPLGSWTIYGYDLEPSVSPATLQLDETCRDALHPGPPYRSGGPFDKASFHTDQYVPKAGVNVVSANGKRTRDCFHVPGRQLTLYVDPPDEDWGDVSDYGAKGWNSYRPTKPRVDAGVAIAELRELPNMLYRSAKDFRDLFSGAPLRPSRAGDAWLNTQFGWLPFIDDVRKCFETTSKLDIYLKQLKRDQNKWVSRGGPVNTSYERTTLEDEDTWGLYPGPDIYLCDPEFTRDGRTHVMLTESQDVWFKARFKYYMPKPESWRWKAKAYGMLFGCIPSPTFLWELTPWSWLIDWCSNTGAIIEMMTSTAVENLCAKYAYIMGHSLRRIDFYGAARYINCTIVGANWYAAYERKTRLPASEFGFGLTDASFSARQWSILAALGLSRF